MVNVCVLADEAGNNVQVVMMHRTQRAVFEIDTSIKDVRSVIPGLPLHVHDTLYSRPKTPSSKPCPCVPGPAGHRLKNSVALVHSAMERHWRASETVEWRNGSTLLRNGASLIVTNGTFRVTDAYYILEHGEQAGDAARPAAVSFRWPDGTLYTMERGPSRLALRSW
jgi:hypothetical protein